MYIPYFYFLLLGLVLGSFLVTTAERLKKQQSLWSRSTCDGCGKSLSPLALIPLLGYLLIRGRCGVCNFKIPLRYPLAELSSGIIAVLIFYHTGWTIEIWHYLLLFETLFLIAILDFQTFGIYPQPVIFGLVVQLIWLVFVSPSTLLPSLLGMFVGAGFFHWVSYLYQIARNKIGLGEGDGTLLGLIGFIFGINNLFYTVFWGSVFGIIFGGLLLKIQRKSLRQEIAFGPWLILSSFMTWFYPEFFTKLPFLAVLLDQQGLSW